MRVVNVGDHPSFDLGERMSADGEGKKRIHFGSLEEVEKKRIKIQQQNGGEGMGLSAAVVAGIKAGNINITEGQIQRVRFPCKLQRKIVFQKEIGSCPGTEYLTCVRELFS